MSEVQTDQSQRRARPDRDQGQPFKHIVIGCDGTPQARDAVALGARIASATGATVSLVGVFPTSLFPITDADRRTMRRRMEETLREERRLLMPEATIEAAANLSVPRALGGYAERWRADLVIIGSDHRAPRGHAMLSRRGRTLLQEASFALAVAGNNLHQGDFELRMVGVGYDGGPEARAALKRAAALSCGSGATLSLLSVVEDRIPALTAKEWMQTEAWSHFWEPQREAALVRAETAVAELDGASAVSAVIGDPGRRLRALSDTVDLIVVGSRRWGLRAHLLAGGVGETLVADCGCSVLIVPGPSPHQLGTEAPDRRHE